MTTKKIIFILLFCTTTWFIFNKNQVTYSSLCQQLETIKIPDSTKQVLIVESMGGIKAQFITCTRTNNWEPSLFKHPIDAVIGRQGLASLGTKKEGDLKTPAGFYPITWTFGTEPIALKMDFKFITSEDKFIDDPKHQQYNNWVNGPTDAHSYELMLHPLYKMGAIINYNMEPTIPAVNLTQFMFSIKTE